MQFMTFTQYYINLLSVHLIVLFGNPEGILEPTALVGQTERGFCAEEYSFWIPQFVRDFLPANSWTYEWVVPEHERFYLPEPPIPFSTPTTIVSSIDGFFVFILLSCILVRSFLL